MKKKYLMAFFAIILFIPAAIAQNCSTLAITSTVDGSVCGEGSVTLEATASGTGDDIYWYDAATNGSYLGAGASFQTPVISATTSYWATEVISSGVTINGGGKLTPVSGNGNSYTADNYGLIFNATSNFTLVDVEVYPTGAGGSVDISLEDNAGVSIATSTVNVPSGSGNTPHTITLNFNVPIGTDYVLRVADGTQFFRENSGISFPYPIGSVGSITASAFPTSTQSTYYYFFYNWTVSTGTVTCESTPREEVIATVNNAGDVVVNALPYTDADDTTNFANNYSGAPGTDCGTTDSYLDANEVVYEYTATADFIMNAELANIADAETSLYVYASCSDIGTNCLAGSVNPSTGDHDVDFSVVNGQTYYIVISSTSGTFPYTFNLDGYLCANYPAPTGATSQDFIDGQALLDLTVSGSNLTWYSDAALTSVVPDSTIMVDNTTYYVTQTFDTCESPALAITPNELLCSVLSVTSSQGNSVCGEGSVTLEAQGAGQAVNTNLWWYDTATGGTPLGKGNFFETPTVSQTTSFWVSEVVAEGTLLTGQGQVTPSGTYSTTTDGGIILDVTQQMTLVDAEVFSTSSAGGTLDVELKDINNGNATVASASAVMPSGGTSSVPIAVTVPLNFNISPGQYRLVKVSGPTFRWESGSFPDPLGTFGSVTGGSTATGSSSNQYIFYNLTVGDETAICESTPRTEVIATVNNVADVVTTNPLPYTHTESTGNFANNYSGMPGNDCDTTGNYLEGNDVVYEYSPDGDMVVNVGLSNITGSGAAIFIYDDCNEIGDSCLNGAVNLASADFGIDEFTVYQGETYYIVISGDETSASIDYTLTIEEATISCSDYTAGPEVDDPEFFNPNGTLDDLGIIGGNLIFYSDLAGTTVLPNTTPAVDGTVYYVSQTLNGCQSDIVPVEVKEINCSQLDVTGTTGDTIPCVGSGTLQATVSGTGTDIYWYENQTGGDPVGYGAAFATPQLTQTTSYWAAEVTATGLTVGGNARLAPDSGSTSYGYANYGLGFTATQQFTLVDVEIYPDGEAGTFDLQLVDDVTGVVLETVSVSVPNMDGATPFVVTLNYDIQPGTYRLVQDGDINLIRDSSTTTTYPYFIGPNGAYGEVTTGKYGTTGTTSGSYYFFYDWTVATGNIICESSREEAIATIDTNGDIQVTTLPYNDSNNDTANYGNPYEGAPGTSCGTTENYLNGNDVVYKFTAANTELVDILMSDLSGFYASVFVYDNCGELLNACLAGAVAGPSDDDFGIDDFPVTAGEDYYIVVSSWLNPTVGYTLDIVPFTCSSLVTPTGLSPQEFIANETLADLEVDTTENPATLSWYSDAAATIAVPDTTVLVDGTTYYVTQTYTGCESAPLAITVSEIDCSSLAIVSSTGDSANCQGALTLTATGSGTGDDVYWYEAATGGNPIEFGNTFTTPALTSTTSYWASEVSANSVRSSGVGLTDWTYTGTSSAASNYRRGLYFDATESFTINTVDVYDASSGGGTGNIELYDTDTDVLIDSKVVNLPGGGSSSSPVKVTLNLNFFVPAAGNYKLVANDAPALKYETDFSNNYLQLPIAIGNVGQILEGGYSYTSGTNEYEYTYDYYYYYFYNWTITQGELICESPREEVIATVNQTGDVLVDYTDLPYNTSDSTLAYGDNFEGDPGSDCPGANYLGGNEVVYQYTADANNDDIVQIELTGVTNPNTGMYLYTSCGEVGTNCLDGATNDTSPSTITIADYSIAAGETLFIVISSESNTVNYTLDIYGFDCSNVAGPIVNDTSPYFVQPNTLDDIDIKESMNSSGIVWYSDAGATMPIPVNTPLVDGTTYYVTQTILGCESAPIAVTPVEFDCTGLSVTAEDALICAPGGDVILTAQAGGIGNRVYWYDAATGGNILNSGSTLDVNVTQTTSYWASEVFINGVAPSSGLGLATYSYGFGSSLFASPKGLEFTANSSFTISNVEVFSTSSAGTMDVFLLDSSGGVLATTNVTIPSGTTAAPTPVTLPLNFTVPGAGTYQLVAEKTSGTVSMMYEYDFSNGVGYPMSLGTVGEITQGVSSTYTYDYYYYYFYNWTIETGEVVCESPREEVVVTVNSQPTSTPTGDAVQKFCEGATVADLVSSGVDLQWYNSNTSSATLALNEALVDGAAYYATQTVDACESDIRLQVTVQVKDNASLPAGSVNQSYVQGETVADLVVQGDNLTWYTSTDGFIFTEIDPTQVALQDQGVYYVTQTPNGLCESAKLKVTVHRDLGLDSPLFEGLSYYPNPMRDKLTIENKQMIDQVELYNMLGQKVISEVSNQKKLNLYVGSLAAGPYFVKVTVDGKSAMIKLIKE